MRSLIKTNDLTRDAHNTEKEGGMKIVSVPPPNRSRKLRCHCSLGRHFCTTRLSLKSSPNEDDARLARVFQQNLKAIGGVFLARNGSEGEGDTKEESPLSAHLTNISATSDWEPAPGR